MKRVSVDVKLKAGQHFYLEPLACLHVANLCFDEEKFLKRIDAIEKEPNRYTVLMGDLHDAIYPSAGEKRYDPDVIDMRYWPPQKGYGHLRDVLQPLASRGKILGISEGNHDRTLWKRFGHNYIKELCDGLDVAHLGVVWFIKLNFPNGKSYVINGAHGRYGGGRLGGHMNKVEDLSSGYDADVYLRAHSHQIGFSERKMLSFDGERKKYFAVVGSFLDGHKEGISSYAEEYDLLPLTTGTISISFNPWEDKIDYHK